MLRDLLSIYPQWESLVSIVEEDGLNYFNIDVPPASGGTAGSLVISSLYNGEITVFFDNYHRHCASILPAENASDSGIEFIAQILREDLAIVSYLSCGDELIREGAFASDAVAIADLPKANHEYFYTNGIRIRSWKGSYDCDIYAPYVSI
jgi:hypothetical protein